jgi:hypothetical protein
MKQVTDKQLDQVRDLLPKDRRWFSTTAESIAKRLGLPNHIVKQAFHKLNLEGVMGQASNHHHRGYDYTSPSRYYQVDPPDVVNEGAD